MEEKKPTDIKTPEHDQQTELSRTINIWNIVYSREAYYKGCLERRGIQKVDKSSKC